MKKLEQHFSNEPMSIAIPEGYEAKIEGNKVVFVLNESDDERIRKELIDYFRDPSETKVTSADKFKKWYDWLEKQKEPEWCHHKVDLSGCSEEYRKGYYDGWNNCNQQHSQLQAEQKPRSTEETELNSLAFLGQLGYTCIPPGKEQKPAEWNEEDKTNGWTGVDLERYLNCLQRLGTGNPQQPETINSKWFKEHCRPQPKQEWSEEDERAIDRACVALRAYSNGELPEFLPSELLGYADRLQALRPQPHWKPSEEQLSALERCVDYLDESDNEDAEAIGSLCHELKNL